MLEDPEYLQRLQTEHISEEKQIKELKALLKELQKQQQLMDKKQMPSKDVEVINNTKITELMALIELTQQKVKTIGEKVNKSITAQQAILEQKEELENKLEKLTLIAQQYGLDLTQVLQPHVNEEKGNGDSEHI